MGHTGLQLRSTIHAEGRLELSLETVEAPDPGPGEVVVRVEAAPINPSDLGLLLGPADLRTAKAAGTQNAPVYTAEIPVALMSSVASRVGQSLPVGNEGAGVVVATGDSDAAKALAGKTVALIGGATYSQYRTVSAMQCLPLPDGTKPSEGAGCFVNPLTALGMVETMRMEGHTALVHTAASSNLGQMLVKVCAADGVDLVNIVRRPEQVDLLKSLGAKHVVDSSTEALRDDLTDALTATGATLAFDATGGGTLASTILSCMEAALSRGAGFTSYGSETHKQVYIYGRLDLHRTELDLTYGMAWGVGGWLLTPFLKKVGFEGGRKLQARVAAELKTTFASHYGREVSLAEALDPDVVAEYQKKSTGRKTLITPHRSA